MGRKRKGMRGFYRGIDRNGRVAWLKSPHAEEEANKMRDNIHDQLISMQDEIFATNNQAIVEMAHGNEETAEELMRKNAELFKDSKRLKDLYDTYPIRKRKLYDWTRRYAQFQEFNKMKRDGSVNDTDGSDPRRVQAKIEGYGAAYDEKDLADLRKHITERASQRERENRYDSWKKGDKEVPDDVERYSPLQRDQLSKREMQRIRNLAYGEDSIEEYLQKGKFPDVDMAQTNPTERAFIRTVDKLLQEDRNKNFDQQNKLAALIYARAMTKGYKGFHGESGNIRDLHKMIKNDYEEYKQWKQHYPNKSMQDYLVTNEDYYSKDQSQSENDNAENNTAESNASESSASANNTAETNTAESNTPTSGNHAGHDGAENVSQNNRRQPQYPVRRPSSSVSTRAKSLMRRIISYLPNVFNVGKIRINSRGGTITGVGIQTGVFNILLYDQQHKAAIYDGLPGSSRRSKRNRL